MEIFHYREEARVRVETTTNLPIIRQSKRHESRSNSPPLQSTKCPQRRQKRRLCFATGCPTTPPSRHSKFRLPSLVSPPRLSSSIVTIVREAKEKATEEFSDARVGTHQQREDDEIPIAGSSRFRRPSRRDGGGFAVGGRGRGERMPSRPWLLNVWIRRKRRAEEGRRR